MRQSKRGSPVLRRLARALKARCEAFERRLRALQPAAAACCRPAGGGGAEEFEFETRHGAWRWRGRLAAGGWVEDLVSGAVYRSPMQWVLACLNGVSNPLIARSAGGPRLLPRVPGTSKAGFRALDLAFRRTHVRIRAQPSVT